MTINMLSVYSPARFEICSNILENFLRMSIHGLHPVETSVTSAAVWFWSLCTVLIFHIIPLRRLSFVSECEQFNSSVSVEIWGSYVDINKWTEIYTEINTFKHTC